MRRWPISLLFFFVLLLSLYAPAQTGYTTTSPVGLRKPAPGSITWSTDMNYNMDLLNQFLSGQSILYNLNVNNLTGAYTMPITKLTGSFTKSKCLRTDVNGVVGEASDDCVGLIAFNAHVSSTSAHGVVGKIVGTGSNNTFTGNNTHSGIETFSGAVNFTGPVAALPMRVSFSNAGAVLTAGTACGVAPRSGTINSITLATNGLAGNATVDLSSETFAAFLAGTAATSMTAGHPVSFTAARGVTVSTFTGWTSTTITAGNVYCFTLSSPATIQQLTVLVSY